MHAVMIALLLMAVDPDSALRDFQKRVDGYVLLHRTLEAGTPPRVITRDPVQIHAASDALAAAIIAARSNARQGDIFSPAVTRLFRERILLAIRDVNLDDYLDDLYEGEDFRQFRAVLHGRDPHCRVPQGLPLDLLWVLPELPSELEYRVFGRDFVLWDEHAALIVDFIPNAFPEQSLASAPPLPSTIAPVLSNGTVSTLRRLSWSY
jgi:hypothetical protein